MKQIVIGLLIVALLTFTSCSGVTIDTDKIKAEYDAGYAAGYARGFIDGIVSCNKTLEIKGK